MPRKNWTLRQSKRKYSYWKHRISVELQTAEGEDMRNNGPVSVAPPAKGWVAVMKQQKMFGTTIFPVGSICPNEVLEAMPPANRQALFDARIVYWSLPPNNPAKSRAAPPPAPPPPKPVVVIDDDPDPETAARRTISKTVAACGGIKAIADDAIAADVVARGIVLRGIKVARDRHAQRHNIAVVNLADIGF